MKSKIDKRLLLLIILILLILSTLIFSLARKSGVPSTTNKIEKQELLPPSPTIVIPTWSEKEDFVEEEFKTKPKKAYDYTLSNGQTTTIYVPEDVNPPPLSVVEEMYRSRK